MDKVGFCKLTAAQYDALDSKDDSTIYFLTDSKIVVLGGTIKKPMFLPV